MTRRKRERKVAPAALERLGPTPEQASRHEYREVDPAQIDSVEQPIGRAWRNVTATPLDRYHTRGNITWAQFRAGDRLRTDWFLSGLEPRIIAAYDQPGTGGDPAWQLPASERQAMARQRCRSAVAAVGIRLSPALVDVVCLERSVAEIGRRLGRSGRNAEIAGMTALQLALDALADHYGIPTGERAPAKALSGSTRR